LNRTQQGSPEHPVVLEAVGVVAGYGGTDVLRHVDIKVRAGEVVCLLGANGAGKTTTMLALSGALAVRAGEVRWFGEVVHDALHHRVRRGLSFVPEARCVFPSLTTGENLRLGRGSVEKALMYVPELEPLMDRRAGLLSGGEQQLLAVARALAGEPQVLLADEVSLGLAPMVTRRLLRALRTAADAGVAVLIVEQHVGKALEVADRGYVMQRGRIALEGSAQELSLDSGGLEQMYLTGRIDGPSSSSPPAICGTDGQTDDA
jgi:branched-chain amino acid transport system ATP-binding protein